MTDYDISYLYRQNRLGYSGGMSDRDKSMMHLIPIKQSTSIALVAGRTAFGAAYAEPSGMASVNGWVSVEISADPDGVLWIDNWLRL